MIDEGWFEEYGRYVFHPGRFPDPKGMMDELHGMGFKVMLWVCPYIRPDGQYFKELFLNEDEVVWLRSAENPALPAIMQWWDGFSAVTDLTNPHGRDWFKGQLDHLVQEYGVDGFKLDGGDAVHYSDGRMLTGAIAYEADATPEPAHRGLRRDRPRLPAERVPGHLEDGRPAAGPAPPGQGAQLGRPAEARPGDRQPGADGLPLQLPRHDRRGRVPLVLNLDEPSTRS